MRARMCVVIYSPLRKTVLKHLYEMITLENKLALYRTIFNIYYTIFLNIPANILGIQCGSSGFLLSQINVGKKRI